MFSRDDVATIRESASRYSAWSGDRVVITGLGTQDRCVMTVGDLPDGKTGAHVDASGDLILGFSLIGGDELARQQMVMHEIGHSFGLQHLPAGQSGIMAGDSSHWTMDFTRFDLDECHRVGHCQSRP